MEVAGLRADGGLDAVEEGQEVMARKITTVTTNPADAIKSAVKTGATALKKEAPKTNRISNLGDWAHPPKKKSRTAK